MGLGNGGKLNDEEYEGAGDSLFDCDDEGESYDEGD